LLLLQGEPPVVWFLTSASCTKIDEIKGCPEVVLAFQNDMSNSWASITGKAEVGGPKVTLRRLTVLQCA
jgi:general stress protein 26